MRTLVARANEARLQEARSARREIKAADVANKRRLPSWARKAPDLLERIRREPEKALLALAALNATLDGLEGPADRQVIGRLIGDIEELSEG